MIDYVELYYFTCIDCGKSKRQSRDKNVALKQRCRTCRFPKVVKGQVGMFEDVGSTENIKET